MARSRARSRERELEQLAELAIVAGLAWVGWRWWRAHHESPPTVPDFAPSHPTPIRPLENMQRDAVLTPQSRDELRAELRAAFVRGASREPSKRELAMLVAHSRLETGNGERMRGFNYGNVTTSGVLPFYVLEGDATHRYRWYPSASEGAYDFESLLAHRYPDAWKLLSSDEPRAYVRALKAKGYFEAEEQRYADELERLYRDELEHAAA